MSSTMLLQQQSMPIFATEHSDKGNPWQWWDAATIAWATNCPQSAVELSWPLVYDALVDWQIAEYNICRGVLGTIAIETAHTFMPVREAFWLSEAWRAANLRYYPWYGRGYIQLTWQSNYEFYGNLIGVNLLPNPDVAMVPQVAAEVLAAYVQTTDVDAAFRAQDWAEGRRLVQGAYAGLVDLVRVVNLLALPGV